VKAPMTVTWSTRTIPDCLRGMLFTTYLILMEDEE
jgi:hypothetical protein